MRYGEREATRTCSGLDGLVSGRNLLFSSSPVTHISPFAATSTPPTTRYYIYNDVRLSIVLREAMKNGRLQLFRRQSEPHCALQLESPPPSSQHQHLGRHDTTHPLRYSYAHGICRSSGAVKSGTVQLLRRRSNELAPAGLAETEVHNIVRHDINTCDNRAEHIRCSADG